MQSMRVERSGPEVQLPIMLAADLQDSLMVVMHDLHRLEGLLSHASDNLLESFSEANDALSNAVISETTQAIHARTALRRAVIELQFQDMASQLILHTTKILQGCAFKLAEETMGYEDDEEGVPSAPMTPNCINPVTQSEMDAGSVELF